VLQCLADLFVTHGSPEHIRSDNGPEFVAINVREWLGRTGVKTLRNGKSMGERLVREPEFEVEGRASERRDLHDAARGSSADRELATPQCRQATFVAQLPSAGPRSDLAASLRSALRSASASPDAGP
jgi:hypothetical protein